MNSYETSATVENEGEVHIAGVPFAPGTKVEVTISRKRVSAEEFVAAWMRVCADLRGRTGMEELSDEDICQEVDRYRAGP